MLAGSALPGQGATHSEQGDAIMRAVDRAFMDRYITVALDERFSVSDGGVAQVVEQTAHIRWVRGSNPFAASIENPLLASTHSAEVKVKPEIARIIPLYPQEI